MTRLAVLLGAALAFLAGLALGVAKPCPEPVSGLWSDAFTVLTRLTGTEAEAHARALIRADRRRVMPVLPATDDWATDTFTEALAKGGN